MTELVAPFVPVHGSWTFLPDMNCLLYQLSHTYDPGRLQEKTSHPIFSCTPIFRHGLSVSLCLSVFPSVCLSLCGCVYICVRLSLCGCIYVRLRACVCVCSVVDVVVVVAMSVDESRVTTQRQRSAVSHSITSTLVSLTS